jgi:hypothetical protein
MKLRNVWNAVVFLVVATAPTFGQPAPRGDARPDFSGIWAHPWLPGFEALASGPTALINLSRTPEGRSIQTRLVGDDKNPILKPEAAETVRKFGEQSKSYFGFHNPRNQCWPNGIPFVLSSNGQQIFDRGDHLTIIYRVDHQVRTVRMNTSHPANVRPSYFGDSVGHYEGGTLVIDTVGIKPGPFAMIDWFGTPQTTALHVVERYRLIDYDQAKEGVQRAYKDNVLPQNNNPPVVDFNSRGKWLQLLFTVDDPNVFTTPWSATVTFGPSVQSGGPGATTWPEDVCGENPNKYDTEEDVKLPTATVADF